MTYSNGQVVAAGKLGNLANVPEGSTHNNGFVSILLIIVEDALDRLDTRVLFSRVLLLGRSLVPVKDATDEGGNKVGTGLGGGNGLYKGEHESQVAVDAMLRLKDLSSLDALPC